ncbi:MAG: FecR domain-containing protein [Saprospiraceae bacterium]|jgi:ferric-dicitrate binding protein FerR (iron transport regulator)|nr:FecR domain-containing protein [Saprospiraceae bacterium]
MALKQKSGWKNWAKLAGKELDDPFHKKLWEASDAFGSSFEPDLEVGLSRFKQKIAKEQGRVVPMKSSFKWMKIAVAVILLLGVGLFAKEYLNSPPEFQVVETTNANTKKIKLTDGTIVFLNENSKLFFPTEFNGDTRIVKVKGEAYFEVAKNPNQPFMIESENGLVRVLGTAFNFRSVDSENFEELTVKNGKVAFSSKIGKESITLLKTQKAILNKKTGEISILDDQKFNALAWKTKKLSFKKENLSNVFKHLKRICKVEFNVENESIFDCSYTVTFPIQNIESALKSLEVASNNQLRFEKIKDGNYKVFGSTCN